MPFTNFPYGVRSFGAPMLPATWGKPVGFGGKGNVTATNTASTVTPGPGSQVFFVNSALATASDASDHGSNPLAPFKTINFAVTRCIANNGDVIYVGPGHTETVASAAAFTIGKGGITIIGVGNNLADMPTVQYATSTAATVTITAGSAWIQGIRFQNSIDARVDGVIVSAADCRFVDCIWTDDTGASSLISVRTTTGGTRLKFYNCRCLFAENTGSARTEFLRIVGGADHEISAFYNDTGATFSTATINNVTTASSIAMTDCIVSNGTTAPAMVFVATSSAFIERCSFNTAAGVSALTLPTTLSMVDSSTIVGNGTYYGPAAVGAPVVFQKSFTSSSLTTSPQTFITCTGGSVIIDGITVETDATGLAGGTNHQLLTNNANGLATLAAETVANLGANKTVDLTAASVTALKIGFILESTKVLQLDNTVGAGTGAGKIFYNIRGRVASGAPVLS